MKDELAQKAVAQALAGEWDAALATNKKILKGNSNDIDTLNRLARAYAETGDLTAARKTSKKVLKIDPFNKIASKSIAKWRGLKRGDMITSGPSSAQIFLEEPGKTKIVSLINLSDAKIIAKIGAGDEVALNPRSHRVSVTTIDGNYVGRLADDISARLKKLISYGNAYHAYVKSADSKEVKIFIRETHRADKLSDVPSFSTEKIDYIAFTPPELVHKKKVVSVEDQEE